MSDSLREESPAFPAGSGWSWNIDPLGSGSEEANQLYLRYYANEESRQSWKRDFPKCNIPPHEDPQYKRGLLTPPSPAASHVARVRRRRIRRR